MCISATNLVLKSCGESRFTCGGLPRENEFRFFFYFAPNRYLFSKKNMVGKLCGPHLIEAAVNYRTDFLLLALYPSIYSKFMIF